MSEPIQTPTAFQYMRPSKVQRMEGEIKALRQQIDNPAPGGSDKNEMMRRVRRMEQTLELQKPPTLSAAERDAYAREEKRLREEFTEEMLSAEEMRRNPAGAVDRQIHFHERNKFKIHHWKNITRALNPEDDSPDLTNIEKYRKMKRSTQPAMHDVQIEGKTFVGVEDSPAYREGWDRIWGKDEAERVAKLESELAELRSLLEQKEPAKPERSKPSTAPEVPMLCGKPMPENRRKQHERFCKTCKEIIAADEARQSSESETTPAAP